jgi:hypothetical protein
LTLILVVALLAAACSDSADTTTTTAAPEATTATTQPPATTQATTTTEGPTAAAPTLTWTGSECIYSGPDTFPKGGEIVKFTYRNESSVLVALYVSPGPGEALSRREVDPDTELTNNVIFRDAGVLALLCEAGDGQFVEGGLVTVEDTTAAAGPTATYTGDACDYDGPSEFDVNSTVTFTVTNESDTTNIGFSVLKFPEGTTAEEIFNEGIFNFVGESAIIKGVPRPTEVGTEYDLTVTFNETGQHGINCFDPGGAETEADYVTMFTVGE